MSIIAKFIGSFVILVFLGGCAQKASEPLMFTVPVHHIDYLA